MGLSKRATDVVVGAFVLLGAAAIVGATMWARQAHLGRGNANATARFRDVGGAGVGTNAFVRGVRAGRIAAIELGDDDWVRVRIALEPSVHLPDDAVVVLGPASLVGDWRATIEPRAAAPDDPDVRRQLAEAGGERGVIPGATLPDVNDVTTGASRIMDDLGAVTGRARVAFDDSAALELRGSIANAQAASARLAAASEAIRRAATRVDSASADGELQGAVRDVATTAADMRATVAELRSLTAPGSETRVVLGRVLARLDTLVARTTAGTGTVGRVMSDPSLYAGTDSLVRELRALVADIRAHPGRYVTVRVF